LRVRPQLPGLPLRKYPQAVGVRVRGRGCTAGGV